MPQQITPGSILQRRAIGQSLANRALGPGVPNSGVVGAIAQAISGGVGGLQIAGANRDEADARREANALLTSSIQEGGGTRNIAAKLAGNPFTERLGQQLILSDIKAQTAARQPTSLQRNLAAAGLKPGTPEFRNAVLKGTQKGTTVNIAGPKKGSQEMFKLTSKAFVDAQKEGGAAQARLVENEVLRQSLSNPDLFTGSGGSVVQTFKEIGQAAGFDVRGVADGQIVETIGRKAALRLKSDLPGPLSNSDRKFLVSLPPGLTKNPEANRRLLLISDLNDQLKVAKAKTFRENLSPDGSVSPAVFEAVSNLEAKVTRQMGGHVKELRAQSRQLKPRSPLAGIPIGKMNAKQLQSLNPNDLTRNQMIEAISRERELDGQ